MKTGPYRSKCVFKGLDETGKMALVDPNDVVLKVTDPADDLTTYTYGVDAEVERTSVGRYFSDLELLTAGTWVIRWEGDTYDQNEYAVA